MGRLCHFCFALLSCLLLLVACGEEPEIASSEDETAKQELAQEPGSRIANTLKWQTASESKIFGFFIYRGIAEEGPFDLLNPKPVAATGTTDDQQQYQFVDNDAEPGRKYFYYLETLDYNNRRKQYSPVFPYQTPAS